MVLPASHLLIYSMRTHHSKVNCYSRGELKRFCIIFCNFLKFNWRSFVLVYCLMDEVPQINMLMKLKIVIMFFLCVIIYNLHLFSCFILISIVVRHVLVMYLLTRLTCRMISYILPVTCRLQDCKLHVLCQLNYMFKWKYIVPKHGKL